MAYTPTQWKSGDVITSEKLNKLENGVAGAGGGGVLIVHDVERTLDKTWQEIADAGFAVLYKPLSDVETEIHRLSAIIEDSSENVYVVAFYNESMAITMPYFTSSPSGYPIFSDE